MSNQIPQEDIQFKKRGRPSASSVLQNKFVEVVNEDTAVLPKIPEIELITQPMQIGTTNPSEVVNILPVQPESRRRFLEVIRDQLKTANGKTGITFVLESKEYLDIMGGDLLDEDLLKILFLRVKDGDERAIIRRFFSNIDA